MALGFPSQVSGSNYQQWVSTSIIPQVPMAYYRRETIPRSLTGVRKARARVSTALNCERLLQRGP